MEVFDAAVIGAGAVGVSTAYHLAQEGLSVAVIEKEPAPALHQSGRNSGVIHAGYNPKPGTLKAEYCVEGNRRLKEYCAEKGVPVREGGILVVARTDDEMDTINILYERGTANGTVVEVLGEDRIREREPHARGIGALLAADAASFDSRAYVHALAGDAINQGAQFFYDSKVEKIEESATDVTVHTQKSSLVAKVAINASGLYADELAGELANQMRVIPFRGYYAELRPNRTDLVNSHIYAAPDLNFPFLGVHLSKRADGRVIVGPGAMLAFGREAYKFSGLKGGGLGETLSWPGFYRMMVKPEFRRLIRKEIHKSLSLKAIGREAKELVPELEERELVRSYAGNRAQLVDRKGNLVDDIVVRETDRAVHVLNAVSPGLTCSLPFGQHLAAQATKKL